MVRAPPSNFCKHRKENRNKQSITSLLPTHFFNLPTSLSLKSRRSRAIPCFHKLFQLVVSILEEMASKTIQFSPLASAKLEFRTKTSDPKHQLFGKKSFVIYTPYGEIYRVFIKARTTVIYWTVQ